MSREFKKRTMPVRVRPADQSDVSFIFNSWLRSFKKSNQVKEVNAHIYYENQHKVIETLLKRCTVMVGVNPEDATQIYGYSVCEVIDGVNVIHYVYVKELFRRLGIGRELVKACGIDLKASAACYTHRTPLSYRIERNVNVVFHPYLLYAIDKEAKGNASKGLPAYY